MGGGGGGARSIGDVRSLLEQAKKSLKEADKGGRRNVFISFAYEDVDSVNLLRAQAKNENLPLEFNDWSVAEPIDSDRAPYIRQKIADRISQCSVTVVYLSPRSAESAWVNWEIDEALRQGKRVIGVYPGNAMPAEIPRMVRERKLRCVPWSGLSTEIEKLK